MKSVFITVVILSSFKSRTPFERNYIIKELRTGKIDTLTWQTLNLKANDTIAFEFDSYKNALYGKKEFNPNH